MTTKERNLRREYPDTTTFHWHNENPDGNIVADCLIRAVALGTGKGWKQTFKELSELAYEKCALPNEAIVYIPYLEEVIGAKPMKQPKKDNGKKYTASQFCRLLDKTLKGNKKVVAHLGGINPHAVCICKVDGRFKVNDTWNSTDRYVGKYWII